MDMSICGCNSGDTVEPGLRSGEPADAVEDGIGSGLETGKQVNRELFIASWVGVCYSLVSLQI